MAMYSPLDIFVIIYIDDILIFSKIEEEHIEHVKAILQRLQEYKLYMKLSKCAFHQSQVKFLGFIVRQERISMDPDQIQTIQEWPVPHSVKEV